MKVAVIGGGAAGFFSAIHVKINHPEAEVVLFEKSKKFLSKVRISGGGRCNVTNGCTDIDVLCEAYPRGGKQLRKAFQTFNTTHTMSWFESRGIQLKTEPDNRVFPITDNSQTIIDCLWREVNQRNIKIELKATVTRIETKENKLILHITDQGSSPHRFDKVIVATGGSPRRKGLDWLAALGHTVEPPVPSLFTFNVPDNPITSLMGTVVNPVAVMIQGTKLKTEGPLLITHWGMSGPAILKLSAFGARILNEMNYSFQFRINWVNEINNDIVADALRDIAQEHPKKLLASFRPYDLPKKFWHYLLNKSDVSPEKRWHELGKKNINKLVQLLTNDIYHAKGKTTFKEEFVTCGGISLKNIDMHTMQSKIIPNLYFAGEVLNIDAITGGYNFQAAWTTAFIAGKLATSPPTL